MSISDEARADYGPGDLNAMYPVGQIDADSKRLIDVTLESLQAAIALCKPGTLFRDVGATIERVCKRKQCTVNRTYVSHFSHARATDTMQTGHGIDTRFHPPPNILHYENRRTPGSMKAGMVRVVSSPSLTLSQCFTIEPMVCLGAGRDVSWPDRWTAVTVDGKRSVRLSNAAASLTRQN